MKVKINNIIFDEKVYPRFDLDNEVVNRYKQALDNLPPIILSADMRLIDGKHRLRAHQLENREDIEAEILNITDDTAILKEAIKRNATHGQQLSREEKKSLARRLWESTIVEDIAKLLSVSTGLVSNWTTDLEDHRKDEEKQKIIELYLKCKNT